MIKRRVNCNEKNLFEDKIVYSTKNSTGKFDFPAHTPFRIKYMGDSHVVMQGLNPKVSLGEYVFDYLDVRSLEFFVIEFKE